VRVFKTVESVAVSFKWWKTFTLLLHADRLSNDSVHQFIISCYSCKVLQSYSNKESLFKDGN